MMWRHRLAGVLAWLTMATVTTGQEMAVPPPTTVGDLMARVRERCEIGRFALGPFQMKVQIEHPATPDVAPTTAVVLMKDDQVLVITSWGAGGSLVKILDDGTSLWCNPLGAMSDVDMRHTVDFLTLGFDCDQLADPLGLSPETPVVVEESAGSSYYRVDQPDVGLRWFDVEDLTLAEEWVSGSDRSVRDVYNNWVPMGAGAWYPELMEQWTDENLTLRLKVEYLYPAPDLLPGAFSLENFYATETVKDPLDEELEAEFDDGGD
jgi:hypothetical protein